MSAVDKMISSSQLATVSTCEVTERALCHLNFVTAHPPYQNLDPAIVIVDRSFSTSIEEVSAESHAYMPLKSRVPGGYIGLW